MVFSRDRVRPFGRDMKGVIFPLLEDGPSGAERCTFDVAFDAAQVAA